MIAACLGGISEAKFAEQKFQQALDYAIQSHQVYLKNYEKQSLEIGRSDFYLAKIYFSLKNYQEALQCVNSSLEVMEKSLGQKSPEIKNAKEFKQQIIAKI
mmetsp:Transcript_1827/g.1719  ORF Transcript_1827/g.1719 Transcript_1827/m.1719 type:complete len:101 (+) Transcript_1827:1157-1459(+)